MVREILREVSALEGINDVTSKSILLKAQRLEVKRVQKEALDSINKAKAFDLIRYSTESWDNKTHKKQKYVENCRYNGTMSYQ